MTGVMPVAERSYVTCVTLYPFSGISYEKMVQKKDPGNDPQCVTSDTVGTRVSGVSLITMVFFGAHGALRPLFPGSLTRKRYRKKIPEMTLNVPHVPPRSQPLFYLGVTLWLTSPFPHAQITPYRVLFPFFSLPRPLRGQQINHRVFPREKSVNRIQKNLELK